MSEEHGTEMQTVVLARSHGLEQGWEGRTWENH